MLKIDLLPRHFAVARTNKIVLAGMVVLLVVVMLGWGFVIMNTKAQIADYNNRYDEVHPKAEEVRGLEQEVSSKQNDLAPIQAKVDFVDAANKSGQQYWERFHAINQYIYAKAQVTSLSITNPDQFNMQAIVGDTTECARFVLNLIRCPAITNVSISGLPAGVSIEGAGAGVASFTPTAGPGAGEEMAPGMEGMEGMEGEPGGAAPTAAAAGEINLSISARLVERVEEPMPPGAGGGAPAAGGMAPPGAPPEPGGEAGAPPGAESGEPPIE